MLSLFAILMTVFGSALAQEPGTPAFKVSEVVLDDHIILVTKDFPVGIDYVVGMGTPDDPSTYIAVAKFNSQDGGALGITVHIPEKFQGEPAINLLLKNSSTVILVRIVNLFQITVQFVTDNIVLFFILSTISTS